MELRQYQREACDAVLRYWQEGGGNPLVEMATGTGKSLTIATLAKEILASWPDMRVIMLVHVQELVEQNATTLLRVWPDAPLGINSAGLGRRDTRSQLLFASIQSVFRNPERLGPRDLILVDEAHLVPKEGEGMYRQLLQWMLIQRPDLRVAGFTATGYRMGSGRLDYGDNRLFSETVYSYDIGRAIDDGYLCPLVARRTDTALNVTGVARRGGEFVASELADAVDVESVTEAACDELVAMGQNRRSWIVFASSLAHAAHIRDALLARGISCEALTKDTDNSTRNGMIRRFKRGELRCISNMGVLTTGFDAPNVDLIALLRPTLSPGLYVQMLGRGTRPIYEDGAPLDTPEQRIAALASGPKPDCLVLDFAGNVRRHGPVDTVRVHNPEPREPGDPEERAPRTGDLAHDCPNCQALIHVSANICPHCDYIIREEAPAHAATPDLDVPVLSRNVPEWTPVERVHFFRHERFGGGTPTMRVEYSCGTTSHREWVCFEHSGFAGEKAKRWWQQLGGVMPAPRTVDEAVARSIELADVTEIRTRPSGQYTEVVARRTAGPSAWFLLGIPATSDEATIRRVYAEAAPSLGGPALVAFDVALAEALRTRIRPRGPLVSRFADTDLEEIPF